MIWKTCLIPLLCCYSVFAFADTQQKASWPSLLIGHGGPIRSISISEDGKFALTSSFDYAIIYWKLEGTEGKIIHRLIGHEASVNDAEFIPGTMQAVSVGDDGKFILWDLNTGEIIKRFDYKADKAIGVAVSSDGRFAAMARWDQTAILFDLKRKMETYVLKGHRGSVNDVSFSQDGKVIYTASYDGQILEWDVASGKLIRPVYNHGWGINVIEVLANENSLLFGSTDGTASIIDIKTGKVTAQLKKLERPILSIAQSQNQKFISFGAGDGSIHVHEVGTWKEIEVQENPTGPVFGLSMLPNGSVVYFTGLDDYAISWKVVPRLPYEKVKGKFIRRFQWADISDPGERQFKRKCSVCHTLTPDGANRAGPTLYKIFGRKAGTLPGYPYSKALLDSNIVWTQKTIKALFSDGPDIITPGSKMPIQRLKNLKHLDALIIYLEKATEPRRDETEGQRIQ